MTTAPVLLAEVSEFVDSVSVERNVFTSGLSQILIILGALLAVIVVSFIGVVIFRKQLLRRKHRRQHYRKPAEAVSGRTGPDSVPTDEIKLRGKRRRVRRKHRHRNPTLAETGGLPPNRGEQSLTPPPV